MSKANIDDLRQRRGQWAKKLERKLPLPYYITISVLCLLPYGLGLLISFAQNSLDAFLGSWTFIVGTIALCVSTTTIFWFESSYIEVAQKTRDCFLYEEYSDLLYELGTRLYRPELYFVFGIPYLCLALRSIYFFCLNPTKRFWPGISRDLLVISACNNIVNPIFIAYIIFWSMIASLILGFITHLVVRIGPFFIRRISQMSIEFNFVHADKVFGLGPILSFIFKLALLYFFDTCLVVFVFIRLLDIASVVFMATISMIGILGVLSVLFGIHKSLLASKKKLYAKLTQGFFSNLGLIVLPSISLREMIRMYVIMITSSEIRKTSTWPINISILTKIAGLPMTPFVTFFVKLGLRLLIPGFEI